MVVYAQTAPRTPRRPTRTAESRWLAETSVSNGISGAGSWLQDNLNSGPGWAIKMTPKKEISPATSCFLSKGACRKIKQA